MTIAAGEHIHCFCTYNTAGAPVCCKCKKVLVGLLV